MRELHDEADFDEAVGDGRPIVNVDKPTKVARLHVDPGACSGVREGFMTKVVRNHGATGSYWVVEDVETAASQWGDQLAICKRCGSSLL